MKLSGLQIEILKRARDILTEKFDGNPCAYAFICDSIDTATDSAVSGSRGIPDSVSAREINRARVGLLNGVAMALCGMPTLRGFMRAFVPGFDVGLDLSIKEGQRVTNLARLAWLDRMIDAGELV
jgi:hypothetical protein